MSKMLQISDLLNPETPKAESPVAQSQGFPSDCTAPAAGPWEVFATLPPYFPSPTSSGPKTNKQPIPLEDIKFGAYRVKDEATLALMRPFGITSTDDIGIFGEHVPYVSEKQDLSEKVGRNSLEIFAYDFYYSHEAPFSTTTQPKKWTVLWDYTIGLVRLTPMFKSLGYQKTKPGNAIGKGTPLADITPSITGGTVKAQGYWLPYACAKAMFATFCYPIAPALIPLFGPSFLSECIHPSSPRFRSMSVDPAILAASTAQIKEFKRRYLLSQSDSAHPTQQTPQQRSPASTAHCPNSESSPANRQERTPRLVSAWSAINTPTSSGGPPTPSSRSVTPASYRRPLVDQRPGPMAVLEAGRLAAVQNRSPNDYRSVELPPIVGHRSVSDSYSMKRRRTHDEESHSYRVHSLGHPGLASVNENKDREEFHAASALLGMSGSRRLG